LQAAAQASWNPDDFVPHDKKITEKVASIAQCALLGSN